MPDDAVDQLLKETPATGPLAAPKSLGTRLLEAPLAEGGAATALRGLAGGQKPFAELTPQERTAAQSPLSLAEAGRLALPFLVNRFIPAGRTVPRIAGQLLGNVVGSAALEGGVAAAKGQDVLPATVEGAVRGVPGGIFQGVAGGVLGPSRSTIKAQKSLGGFLQAFSPEVSKTLAEQTRSDVKALFSDETIRSVQSAAGKTLDAMEATLGKSLSGKRFEFPQGTGPRALLVTPGGPAGSLKVPFEEIRAEIKRLRTLGETAFANPERQFKLKQKAARIEQAFLGQLEAQGLSKEAETYRQSIQTFAQDRGILRALKAVRQAQQIPGGLNRADSPIVAAATDTLNDPGLGPAARAAAMSALALSGHPFMALHFSGFGRRGGILDPNKVRLPLGRSLVGPLSAGAGSVGSALFGLTFPSGQAEAAEQAGSISEHRRRIEETQRETAPAPSPTPVPAKESDTERVNRLLQQMQQGGPLLSPQDFKFLQEHLK